MSSSRRPESARLGEPASGPGAAPAAGTEEVVHRGITWRRSASGRALWRNEGLNRWVVWAPGSDAPPLPPGWGAPGPAGHGGNAAPAPGRRQVLVGAGPEGASRPRRRSPGEGLPEAMKSRPPMTSPYRLVPVLVTLLIIALAVYQATRPAHATSQDIAQAEGLKGQCLARSGGTAADPTYSTTPVSCGSPQAAAKVVAVERRAKGASCPKGTVLAMVVGPGLNGEPFECLVPLGRR